MKRSLILATLAVAVGLLLLFASNQWMSHRGGKEGLTRQPDLTGTWMQRSRIVNGAAIDDPAGMFLVVTEDGRMERHVANGTTWLSGSTIVNNQHYRITWKGDCATIDKSGRKDWSEMTRGICRLDGDTLTICLAPMNQPRPSEFATDDTNGGGNVVMEFTRSK